MITTFLRIIKYGFLSFWRNALLSTATLSVIILALLVFEGLIISNVLTKTALTSLQEKIDISIYFKNDTLEDDVLKIKKSLEGLAEVKKVEYISKDKALEIFKEKHKDDPAIKQSLEELEENPLLASLNIKANDPQKYGIIADYLDKTDFKTWFEKVTYAQNAIVIERLGKIIDTAEKGAFVLIIFLALIAILITFNTIRLAIYSNREEIGIMRLVGASNSFIRGPYVIEGIIYGLIAGIFSVIIALPIIYFLSPYIQIFIAEMNLWNYFTSNFIGILIYQLIFGVALGVISSVIAVRKYLKI
ncbi:ABC transporter permease [Candidatus Wolfebacteria bacterium]|nr:ABC transporter permease [Candidatus Wolfebacteria bacterium]